MRNVSNSYKDVIRGPRQKDGKIILENEVIDSSQLNLIKYSFQSDLFKSIMQQVDVEMAKKLNKETNVNPQFALYVNNDFEWISFDNFSVYDSEKLEDVKAYAIKCYDKIVESMIPYDLQTSFPKTVREYFVAIFERLKWPISGIPETFTNSSKLINQDFYTGLNYNFRKVLDELCTICAMWLIDDHGIPTLTRLRDTDITIDETYLNQDDVTIGNKVYFNSLVFSRVDGIDNIFRNDEDDIKTNGLHEFKISDNQLLSTNDRDLYIDELWEYLKNFNYYSYDIKSVGITFLEKLDKFNIQIGDNVYSTFLANDEIDIGNGYGLAERLYNQEPTETTTDYQYASDSDNKIGQAYALLDKQSKRFEVFISDVEELKNNVADLAISADSINATVSETVDNMNAQETRMAELEAKASGLDITVKETRQTVESLGNLSDRVGSLEESDKTMLDSLNGTKADLESMRYSFTSKALKIGSEGDDNYSLYDNKGVRIYSRSALEAIYNKNGSGVRKLIITEGMQFQNLKMMPDNIISKNFSGSRKGIKGYYIDDLIQTLEDLEE